jgi:O-antigen ligase
MVIAIAVLLSMRNELGSRFKYLLALAALGACLYFTGFRGSMLAGIIVAALLTIRWFLKSPGAFLTGCALAATLLPVAQWAVETVQDDYGTWGYRQQLIDAAIPMILDRPVDGYNGISAVEQTGRMEHLRQGEGIIDIVNTYIYVALFSGLVGLALFVAMLVSALLALVRRTASDIAAGKGMDASLSLPLSAILVSACLLIVTTSMIGYFQDYFFLILALTSALVAQQGKEADLTPKRLPAATLGRTRRNRPVAGKQARTNL